MEFKKEINTMISKLKTERDNLKLSMHLASMEAKDEFEEAEKKWKKLKEKASNITDDFEAASDEVMTNAKIIGEELNESYNRIKTRLKK
jgi:archaellum component FlaC